MNRVSKRSKSKNDLDAIQAVQRSAEGALQEVILYLKNTKNPTSEEAREIVGTILEKSNCYLPEGCIVAGGIQSADPHEIGSGVLSEGKMIVIDIYPKSRSTGYWGDITRTISIGSPKQEVIDMYEVVLEAQCLAIDMIKPGVRCFDIQQTIETFFENRGYITHGKDDNFLYKEGFVHSLGHGIGTCLHEEPKIGRDSEDVLLVGDTITIEPGLYYKNIGGIRIEDLLVVTEEGCVNLTNFSKKFIY